MKTMTQLTLVSDNAKMVTWVEKDKRIKLGSVLTLKDSPQPDRLWKVQEIGTTQEASEIKRGWNNNI